MMNQHLSKGTTTPDTELMTKHAGWAAVLSGKEAWIIDNEEIEEPWFEYTCNSIAQMRHVRKHYCKVLRKGLTL